MDKGTVPFVAHSADAPLLGRPRAWLFLTALWAVFHAPSFLEGRTFVLKDASRLFYSLWKWASEAWAQGGIPLWNPEAGFGTPVSGDPESALWYFPLRILYGVLEPVTAFTVAVLVHHLSSFLGFFEFCRVKGRSGPASLFGAMAFGLSLHAVASLSSPVLLFSFSWIPWIFLLADRASRGWNLSFFFLGPMFGFQISAGFPIVALLTFLGVLAERSLSAFRSGKASWDWPARSFLAFGIGVGLNLQWVLPFLEFMGLSNVSNRLQLVETLPVGALWTWLEPFHLSHPLHAGKAVPFELGTYYLGIPMVACLLWGAGARKLPAASLVTGLVLLLLSLGWAADSTLDRVLPVGHWIVRSGYWMPLVIFVFSYLGTRAAEAAMAEGRRVPRAALALAGASVSAAALSAGVPVDLPEFWVSLFLFLAAIGSVSWRPRLRWVLLLASAFVSLWPAARSVHFTLPGEHFRSPPKILGAAQRPGRIYHSFPMVQRLAWASGTTVAEAQSRSKEALSPNWPLAFGREECFFYHSFFLPEYFKWCFNSMTVSEEVSRKTLDYLNVRYVVGYHRFRDLRSLPSAPGEVEFSENPDPLPKWLSVLRSHPQGNFRQDLERIGRTPSGFGSDCTLAGSPSMGVYSRREVAEMERTRNGVRLEARGGGRALLVSSEMNYPGWRAYSGGREIPVLEVNHGFRGVILEEGETGVRMEFSPTTFRLGLFLALTALGILGAFGSWLVLGRRFHARI